VHAYLELMRRVLREGEARDDRTGVGTLSLFGTHAEFDLRDGFPAVTTKRLAFRQVAAELACFLRAHENLEDFHREGCAVWDANASAPYWLSNPNRRGPGDVGRTYGVQWRRWRAGANAYVDQLRGAVETLRRDPGSRRAVVTAWNPAELDMSCLPPCHHAFQFSVRRGRDLDCLVTMRSVDVFLGMPFDVASYALLTHLAAKELGLAPGVLAMSFGDTHVYNNHAEACERQLAREPLAPPLVLLRAEATLDNFDAGMATLHGYDHHGPIPGEMNV
jgi:thymidylate synthase